MALTYEEYYGDDFFRLKRVEEILLDTIRQYPAKDYADGVEPILYCKSRIKNPDSMIHKLKKRGVATDGKTAIRDTHDAVGVRIICSFIDDVYKISQWMSTQNNFTIVATKDYIAYPKPNGYRSFHMILGIQVYSMDPNRAFRQKFSFAPLLLIFGPLWNIR